MSKLVLRAALAAAIGLATGAAAHAQTYRVVVLPASVPGTFTTVGAALNNRADVVGWASDGVSNFAAVWPAPAYTMQRLPDLSPGVPGDTSLALAINDSGVVAGHSDDGTGNTLAVSWIGGTPVVLGDLPGGEVFGIATGVNAAGQVAGMAVVGGPAAVGYRWNGFTVGAAGGPLVNIGDLPGGFNAAQTGGINAAGKIVGRSSVRFRFGGTHAFLWSPGSGMLDLGVLPGGSQSEATAINDSDVVVGWSASTAGQRAFRWTAATGLQDLGSVSGATASSATGVNAGGWVVGVLSGVPGVETASFLWRPGAGMVNLIDLVDPADPERASLTPYLYASGINDSGAIVATGRVPGSTTNNRALLLVPVP